MSVVYQLVSGNFTGMRLIHLRRGVNECETFRCFFRIRSHVQVVFLQSSDPITRPSTQLGNRHLWVVRMDRGERVTHRVGGKLWAVFPGVCLEFLPEIVAVFCPPFFFFRPKHKFSLLPVGEGFLQPLSECWHEGDGSLPP